MQAITYTAAGSLELVERPLPVPGPGQVLVEVSALGICGTDLLVWNGGLSRVRPPVILGHEFAGIVIDDNGADGVAVGDRVAVEPLLNCGVCTPCLQGAANVCRRLQLVGIDCDGAAASVVVVPAARLHRVPDELALTDAALAEPTAVALHMAARAGVAAGQQALVVGGGPIGALVATVCRSRGVGRVVVSEPNSPRRELLGNLGFETFDPSSADLGELIAGTEAGDGFDVTFELTGVAAGLEAAVTAARIHGCVLLGGLPHGPVSLPGAQAVLRELTLRGARVYSSAEFQQAVALLTAGQVDAGRIVTRRVPLADAIDGAFGALRRVPDDMKILILP